MKILRALRFSCWLGLMLGSLGWKSQLPATAAEKISFWYGALEFSVDIDDLKTHLGEIDRDLVTDVNSVNSESLKEWRSLLDTASDESNSQDIAVSLLTQEFPIDRVTVSRLLNSSLGTRILQSLGEIIRVSHSQNGFYALRSALILAIDSSEKLTLLDVLRQFPADTIQIDAKASLKLADVFTQLQTETKKAIALVKQQAAINTNNKSTIDFAQQPDIQNPGYLAWQQETLTLFDQKRDRSLAVDLYRPQIELNVSLNIPLVIISHGFSGAKEDFDYLAQHLASYGMAVAILNHPGSDRTQLDNFFAGTTRDILTAREFIHRPQDVSYLLDELQKRERVAPSRLGTLDLERVGIIGHSFGSYTALALGGAKLNIGHLQQYCPSKIIDLNWFNPSVVLQCLASQLSTTKNYQLGDRRIAAIFAMNPMISNVFGEQGLSQLEIPVAFVGGSKDLITPVLLEQIEPFTWLGSQEKYLLLIDRGTHGYDRLNLLETLANSTIDSSFDPQLVRGYIKTMSLAFMQTHLANQTKYQRFLTNNYVKHISKTPLKLSLTRSIQIKSTR